MRILKCLALLLSFVAAAAGAQTYPDKSRPIRIIVPSGAASSNDLLARAYAKAMAEVAGLNVIVDNKAGAETVVGVQALMASPPDGYVLMISSSSTQVLNPVMIPNLPYDPFRDLTPLVGVGTVSVIMNLGASTTFTTAREFIAAARANPGKYTCASATANARLACELLQSLANIKLLNVPYKTTAAGVLAVVSGEADMIFSDPGSSAAQWQTGRLRPVAASGPRRIVTLPNIPTLREEGVAEYDVTAWFATYFPAHTPPEVVVAMRDILQKSARTKLVTDTLTSFSMEPLNMVGDQLTALNRREIDMWAKLIRTANIKFN